MSDAGEKEPFYAGQGRILEMMTAGEPLAEILTKIVLLMEAQAQGLRCSILLLSHDGKHMQHGAAPNLPQSYCEAVNGAAIGPRVGSCGTAMFRKQPVIVTDVLTDPLWADYIPLAKILGLRACWSTPIMAANGDVLGTFAMYREKPCTPNSEEKRLIDAATHIASIGIERAKGHVLLRERDTRISLAAESANLAFWVLYPEQDTAWMSEKGRAMYGFRAEEQLTGESLLSRVHPDERFAVKLAFDRARGSHAAIEVAHRIVNPYGKTTWVIVRGRFLWDECGNVLEIVGVTIDVTAQKNSDLELQAQREQMEHLSRVSLMGELTASLGHELNQPLAAIKNNASAARRFLDRGQVDEEMFRQLLADISEATTRATGIIDMIRKMVRRGKSARVSLNLNAAVEDILRLIHSDAAGRETTITTELDARLPEVEAAPVEIQQVLLNLVINAMDAVSSVPPIQRRIIISTHLEKGPAVCVSVRDFGTGLPKGGAEKVFDHFFSTKAQGMGMGLAIAKSIIEGHAGTLAAENVEGGGARFFFRLPTAQSLPIGQAAA